MFGKSSCEFISVGSETRILKMLSCGSEQVSAVCVTVLRSVGIILVSFDSCSFFHVDLSCRRYIL